MDHRVVRAERGSGGGPTANPVRSAKRPDARDARGPQDTCEPFGSGPHGADSAGTRNPTPDERPQSAGDRNAWPGGQSENSPAGGRRLRSARTPGARRPDGPAAERIGQIRGLRDHDTRGCTQHVERHRDRERVFTGPCWEQSTLHGHRRPATRRSAGRGDRADGRLARTPACLAGHSRRGAPLTSGGSRSRPGRQRLARGARRAREALRLAATSRSSCRRGQRLARANHPRRCAPIPCALDPARADHRRGRRPR